MFRKCATPIIVLVLLLACGGAGAQDSFRFIVTGDSRGGDNGINAAILVELADVIASENADLVLFTGDLVNSGTQAQLENWINTFMQPLLAAGIGVFPCRGNHDSSITAWNAAFSGDYALPDNGPAGEENLTYYFTHKNALFVSVDEYMFTHLLKVDQTWLDQVLAANTTLPHVFVYGHVPAFIVNHTDCLASYPANRDTFWNSLGRAGGRLYFCGHDHFYNHAWVMDSASVPIHQYIVGSAGAPLYDWDGVYPEGARVHGVKHLKTNGYTIVDVNGFDVQVTFKERIAPNVYVATDDILAYTAPYVGEGVPASGPVALLVLLLCIALTFAAWRVTRAGAPD